MTIPEMKVNGVKELIHCDNPDSVFDQLMTFRKD
jgi:hypothetical protein